jgi:hypothetical protein
MGKKRTRSSQDCDDDRRLKKQNVDCSLDTHNALENYSYNSK